MPHKLFLTTRVTGIMKNTFNSNIPTYIKYSQAETSKIIQSGRYNCNMLGNLGIKIKIDLFSFLASHSWPGSVNNFF